MLLLQVSRAWLKVIFAKLEGRHKARAKKRESRAFIMMSAIQRIAEDEENKG